MQRLHASLEELSELFQIELAPHVAFAVSAPRDMRRWTTDDSDQLVLLYEGGSSAFLIALLLGHSTETVRRWTSALSPRRHTPSPGTKQRM
jgi:transposase-like protein